MDQRIPGIDRMDGAAALSAKAMSIGAELGVPDLECVWDMGEDLAHEHAHRLELITAEKTVRLYFPDLELSTAGNTSRAMRSENRLRQAISQLVPRIPLPTYAYR